MAMRKGLPAKLAATDADDTRYDLSGLVVQNADGSPRGGLLGPIRNVVSSRANMAVDVALFKAAAARDGGTVLLANDGTVQVTITAAPASNSRYTVIYAKQNDSSSTVTTPDANDTPVLATVDGTAAPSPTKPSIPVGSVEVGWVLVPAGATATNSGGVVIGQTATYTAAQGGLVPFRTQTDLLAWTTAGPSQHAIVTSDSNAGLNGEYVWDGTTWSKRLPGGRVIRSSKAATFGTGWNLLGGDATYWTSNQAPYQMAAFDGTWTIPMDGLWHIEAGCLLDSTVNVALIIKKNNSAGSTAGAILGAAFVGLGSTFTPAAVSGNVVLHAGDVLRAAILPSATGTVWNTSLPDMSFFAVRYIETIS